MQRYKNRFIYGNLKTLVTNKDFQYFNTNNSSLSPRNSILDIYLSNENHDKYKYSKL